jgi:hypothetical protein
LNSHCECSNFGGRAELARDPGRRSCGAQRALAACRRGCASRPARRGRPSADGRADRGAGRRVAALGVPALREPRGSRFRTPDRSPIGSRASSSAGRACSRR